MSQTCLSVSVSSKCPGPTSACCSNNVHNIAIGCGKVSELFCFCDTKVTSGEKCPGSRDIVAHSAEVIVDGNCVIPDVKPCAEKLLKIYHSVSVTKAVTVDSKEPKDGQFVDGKKVLVAGFLKLGFEYSALEPQQSVHYFGCDIPFNALVLNTTVDGSDELFPAGFDLDDFIVNVCVEELKVQQVDPRTFSKAGVLMVWLEPKG